MPLKMLQHEMLQHTHKHTCIHTHARAHMQMHTCMHTHAHMHMHMHMYTRRSLLLTWGNDIRSLSHRGQIDGSTVCEVHAGD